jgi:subtilisin-like proprotein convertase family protein
VADNKNSYRVFIASPSDLAEERRAFKEAIDDLNKGFAAGADAHLEALAWEETLSTVGRRSQSVINDLVDKCDCFVLILHRRWGQKAPDSKYSSYTEEEYYRALDRFNKTRAPRIFIFLKSIEAAFMADPGPQLKKVLTFRRKLENTRQVLYRSFDDLNGFRRELDVHLQALIKGKLPALEGASNIVGLSVDSIERVQKAEVEAERLRKEAEEAKREAAAKHLQLEKASLLLAHNAARAAQEGHIEEARQAFAVLTDGTTNLDILVVAGQFFYQVGELDRAEELLRRVLFIGGPNEVTDQTAASFETLGLICQRRDDRRQAEAMHRKALEIYEKLGRQELIARHYSQREFFYQERGERDKAAQMRRKALETNEGLGRKVVRQEVSAALMIPDNDPMGLTSPIAIVDSGTIQAISVSVHITHTYIGDLRVELLTPWGQIVVLHDRAGGSADNLLATYTPDSIAALANLIGKEVRGEWVLKVRDLTSMDVGRLNKWGLELGYAKNGQ